MNTHTHTHTPGPWESVEARVYQNFTVCGQPSSRLVCSCSTHSDYTPWAEQNANAQLIAAAPELLEALEDAAFLMRMAAKIAGPMQDSFKRSAEDAAKALAKAEGQA